ncbi:hypothetical protein BS78_08G144500 [Paspalum vaginatum]|nr:hypothetical protein BS78_08G144500 [Paspalum vaginatum]
MARAFPLSLTIFILCGTSASFEAPYVDHEASYQGMAAVKLSAVFCFTLLFMALILAPSRAGEACDQWLSDTYRMLFLCSSKICNEHCIAERGAPGGSVASSSPGPSAFAPKNATEPSDLSCNGDFPFSAVVVT